MVKVTPFIILGLFVGGLLNIQNDQASAKATPKVVRLKKIPSAFFGTWHYYDRFHHRFVTLKLASHSFREGKGQATGQHLIVQRVTIDGHNQYAFFSKRKQDDCSAFALYHLGKVLVNGRYHRAILLDGQEAFLPVKTRARVTIPKAYRY